MPEPKPVRIQDLKEMKQRGQRIAVLTAYDASMARLMDRAGIDVLLVGDSLGMVVLGYETTLPVTLEDMIRHTQAVVRGTRHALVVADMPFLSYQVDLPEAVRSAGRLMKEGGAAAVKVEGGRPVTDVARRLVEIGIPVMGHLGLVPQSVHQLGGYRTVARKRAEAQRLLEDGQALEEAGVFAIVLESIPAEVAAEVSAALTIPTIGIGAGAGCDGQVLVSYDAFGIFDLFRPHFVKRYAEVGASLVEATQQYIEEVRAGTFPGEEHSVHIAKKVEAQ